MTGISQDLEPGPVGQETVDENDRVWHLRRTGVGDTTYFARLEDLT
ncbi:hypothetical protein [Micromonospora rosaria]|nr:hypothetical protein [Micromonospora rosaria]